MSKVLITGSNGLCGQAVLATAPSDLQVIGCNHAQCDITDPNSLRNVIEQHQPDIIINTAAFTHVDRAEQERTTAYRVNCDGASYLAQACAHYAIPLLHISTDYVFDGDNTTPWCEADNTNPINFYGHSKLNGEKRIQQHWSQHVIVRTSALFGDNNHNFVAKILHNAHHRDTLSVVTDQITCPTAASDLAAAIWRLVAIIFSENNHFPWGIYHYCSNRAISWYDFATHILHQATELGDRFTTTLLPTDTKTLATPAPRPLYSVLDCQKIQSIPGVKTADWQQALYSLLSTRMQTT